MTWELLVSLRATSLLTKVLLTMTGALPPGSTRLIARVGLLTKRLLVMVGEEPLMKPMTPERCWVSAVLLRKMLESMMGEETLPPMAAPYPPAVSLLPSKMLLRMSVPTPLTDIPAPKAALAPEMVKPEISAPPEIWTAVPP